MPSKTVDEFLAALPEDVRHSLQALRAAIEAAVPEATEAISYGVPVFKLARRPLVGYGAAKQHCSFYLMSTGVVEAHNEELKGYKLGKGTVHFPIGTTLPEELVATLVRARIAENQKPDSIVPQGR